ncbi:MAG: LTA synthase family protein [Bacilli bacterium]|nr:LTA synthase family protein [Bacilli bacterium]
MKVLKKETEKLLKIIKYIINFLIQKQHIFYMTLPLLAMDIITRLFGYNIDFYSIGGISPNLFTITWLILFIGLTLGTSKKIGKIIYLTINILFLIIFLVNNVYYSMTSTFFDFNLLESASEGAPYIIDTIKNANILVYISFISIIFLIYHGYKRIPYKTKNNPKLILSIIIIFLISHIITPLTLGKANEELTWSSWRNPRNIYMSFNDSNKSLKVSGLFEYTIRNFYVTYLKTDEIENYEDEQFLESAFANYEGEYKNKYTGKFKNKNLIFVQLEGTDNWLINKSDTPTLYNMMKSSFNFTNHYSYYNGGGSTFNSEFAVNTGFITPLSYTQNAYTFNKNNFPYSMANLFKNDGYIVNAFHMNTGEYYSRTANYLNWGYNNYYGLIDIEEYTDESYTLDRELILNEKFNELIFPNDTTFVDYIIAYSGHLPFTNTKGVCKQLVTEDIIKELGLFEKYNEGLINLSYKKETKENNPLETNLILVIKETFTNDSEDKIHEIIIKEMTEEECVRRQAKETDYMMELLLENLKEKNLLDNTVIVVFTDHYLYTLEDKTLLDKYKETKNNLINKTPFFIWSNNTKEVKIKEPTSQLNILPTVLNLFGMEYNPNNYIGEDALNPKYDGIVFFNDYSWYDGNVYVEDGEVTNNKNISYDKLEEKNYYINYITKKNDLALKFNYFKLKK